jgi:hypothetical protein
MPEIEKEPKVEAAAFSDAPSVVILQRIFINNLISAVRQKSFNSHFN